jgi:thymidylate kinase
MRDTHLIFVEGLPGSGKSTTARYIADRLQQAHMSTQLLAEVEPDHPLNVGGALHPAGDTTGADLFAQYTIEAYRAESLTRWTAFVSAAVREPSITVLDSYPYQNAARVLLQLDASPEVVRDYAREVEALTQSLTPVLVFIRRDSTPESFAATTSARGEAWTAYAIEVMTNCPYARHRQLTGGDGALAMLAAYEALLEQLLHDSRLPRIELAGCQRDWQACYERLDAFLSL